MRFPQGPARSVAIASLVIVPLIAAAVAVTLWRYEEAIVQDRKALLARVPWELAPDFRRLGQLVPAAAPVVHRAGPASATFLVG